MQSFTDFKGERWDVVVSVDTVRRVRRTLDVDMLDVEPFLKQMQDVVTLCDILYVACEPEARERNVDSEEFGRRLLGPAIRQARDALMEAYINFTPDPATAEKLRVVMERYAAVGEKTLAALEARMPKIVKQIDAEVDAVVKAFERDVDKSLDENLGRTSTD